MSAEPKTSPAQQNSGKYGAQDPRRRTPRRAYGRSVGVLAGGRYAVFDGRSLSEGGVGVSINDDPEWANVLEKVMPGVKVLVSMILPSGVPLILRGLVVHHGVDKGVGHTVGIKFDTFALHQRREVRYYVSAKEAGESDLP